MPGWTLTGSLYRGAGPAAADREPRRPLLFERLPQPRDQCAYHGGLVGGGEVCTAALGLLGPQVADPVEQSGLQPAEAEVEPAPRKRAGEVERLGVPFAREPVERGAARIAEPEQASPLVERLARRVVERLPKHVVLRRLVR